MHKRGGDLRRFYTNLHQFDCGIDRHARPMSVCLLPQDGAVRVHRTMQAAPDPCLKAVAPSRDGLVGSVEWLFPGYWLADLWAQEGIPLVVGHALSKQAMHGGTATNDTSASHNIATLLRGGRRPQASGSPAEMPAPRDRRRRRMPLRRKRAALLAPGHNTHRQYHLPESGKKIAYTTNRDGVAQRFAEPAGPKNSAVDLALLTQYEELLRDLERSILTTAKQHEATTLSLLQTVPGIGKILSRVLLYDIHDIDRFPRVQDCASQCRLVTCAKASGGKRLGTSGKKIGNAHLKGALSEAAGLFLRNNEPGHTILARLEKKHDKGNALSSLAHKLGRAG